MWTVHIDGGPRRVNHSAVAIDDKIYSFGGYCSGEQMDEGGDIDIHVLNTQTFRWSRVYASNKPGRKPMTADESERVPMEEDDANALPDASDSLYGSHHLRARDPVPYQRYGHTVCAWKGKVYLWGGRSDAYGASSFLHEFDPETRLWRILTVCGRVPASRDGHTAVVVGDQLYLFGGFEENLQRFSQETYVFDFNTRKWSEFQTTGQPPSWRDFHTAAVLDNKMYIFGGRSDQMGQFHSTRDVYDEKLKCLDLTTGEWMEPAVKGSRPGGRRSHSVWTYKGRMYIFGGFYGTDNKHNNDLYEFNPEGNEWKKLVVRGEGPCPRRRQCTVLIDDRVFLFGGTKPSAPSASTTNLTDLSDLFVLDYLPTLFSLSARVVLERSLHTRFAYYIPRDVMYDVQNMITPNSISNESTSRVEASG